MASINRVFLDTDFLVFCAQHNIDYMHEIHRLLNTNFSICMLDKTLDELEVVSCKTEKNRVAVRLAKTVLAIKKPELVLTDKSSNTDSLLLARNDVFAVCTQDKMLKTKLKIRGILIITARQGKYLAME